VRTKEEKGLGGELAPLEGKKTKAGQILQSFTAYHDAEESRKDGKAGFAGGEGDGDFFFFWVGGRLLGRTREEKRACGGGGFGIKIFDEGLVAKVY
jgi:hypothetical protein